MNKLINYIQEKIRLDEIRFNRTSTLLQVMVDVSKQANIEAVIREATILVPVLDTKRVNLHYKFDLQELQLHSTPEALKLALQYVALNNPLRDLWVVDEMSSLSAATLKGLRTIDTLLAFASELVSDDHISFAEKEGIATKAQEMLYRDLEAKRLAVMKSSLISSDDLYLQMIDPQILIYVAWISHQPPAIYTVYGVDANGKNKTFHITPDQAAKIVIEWHQKFTRVHLENIAQREKIVKGTYRATFQFTPLGDPL
jgi:hypothetical protein